MTDGDAILRSVLATPEDDAPRLILSDWLDENGDHERAALIRRMVALPTYRLIWTRKAKHVKHLHNERVRDVRGLKGRLAELCRADWLDKQDVERVVMRRGFVEAITMATAAFIRDARQLFAFHPISEVTLSDLFASVSYQRYGHFEATLAIADVSYNRWPKRLFPERPVGTTLYYPTREAAYADLSRHAAGFGRRKAGVPKEPPPLPTPNRPTISVEVGHRCGAPRVIPAFQ
jgi:uncharacterized protein (TIGR02996 family)